MSDEDAGAAAPEKRKRGRPRKATDVLVDPYSEAGLKEDLADSIYDINPVNTPRLSVQPVCIRMLKSVQLNSECFPDRPERPAKLRSGDVVIVYFPIARDLIASGKAVRV